VKEHCPDNDNDNDNDNNNNLEGHNALKHRRGTSLLKLALYTAP
jgi:hypothetical protein